MSRVRRGFLGKSIKIGNICKLTIHMSVVRLVISVNTWNLKYLQYICSEYSEKRVKEKIDK